MFLWEFLIEMATFHCAVVSAKQEIFDGEASFLVATGELGELGIAPGHAPLLTRLNPGKVVVTSTTNEQVDIAISGGILEVQPHSVTVLADTAIRAEAIDEVAVRQAKKDAEQLLAERKHPVDVAVAEQQLIQANVQLQAIARWQSQAHKK